MQFNNTELHYVLHHMFFSLVTCLMVLCQPLLSFTGAPVTAIFFMTVLTLFWLIPKELWNILAQTETESPLSNVYAFVYSLFLTVCLLLFFEGFFKFLVTNVDICWDWRALSPVAQNLMNICSLVSLETDSLHFNLHVSLHGGFICFALTFLVIFSPILFFTLYSYSFPELTVFFLRLWIHFSGWDHCFRSILGVGVFAFVPNFSMFVLIDSLVMLAFSHSIGDSADIVSESNSFQFTTLLSTFVMKNCPWPCCMVFLWTVEPKSVLDTLL